MMQSLNSHTGHINISRLRIALCARAEHANPCIAMRFAYYPGKHLKQTRGENTALQCCFNDSVLKVIPELAEIAPPDQKQQATAASMQQV
jgi:hypothetical protein